MAIDIKDLKGHKIKGLEQLTPKIERRCDVSVKPEWGNKVIIYSDVSESRAVKFADRLKALYEVGTSDEYLVEVTYKN